MTRFKMFFFFVFVSYKHTSIYPSNLELGCFQLERRIVLNFYYYYYYLYFVFSRSFIRPTMNQWLVQTKVIMNLIRFWLLLFLTQQWVCWLIVNWTECVIDWIDSNGFYSAKLVNIPWSKKRKRKKMFGTFISEMIVHKIPSFSLFLFLLLFPLP